jgi:hypothetical protein
MESRKFSLLGRHVAIARNCCLAFAVFWLLAGHAQANPVTLPGIAHEYSFNENSGTATADSVGGINASLEAFGPGNTQWIPGAFGNGILFTNENALVITDLPLSEGAASAFSISFWSRLDSVPNLNDSVTATPQLDNWITYNPTGNTNAFGKTGIGVHDVRAAIGPTLGVWENYVVTFDRTSGVLSVYKNGAIKDFGVVSLPVLNTRWVFGHNQGPGNTNGSWHGALDEIQFYDRVLTASDAAALATVPEPGTCIMMAMSLGALLAFARPRKRRPCFTGSSA